MGIYFEELPLLASCAFTHVCDAAREGAGVDSAHYRPFAAWMGDGRPLADAVWASGVLRDRTNCGRSLHIV